jgi:hypothetical protein
MLKEELKAIKVSDQVVCPHMQGSFGPHTSIVWHVFEDDAYDKPKGICTNCIRIFRSTDEDYEYWRSRRSGNLLSTCALPRTRADGTVLARPEPRMAVVSTGVDPVGAECVVRVPDISDIPGIEDLERTP